MLIPGTGDIVVSRRVIEGSALGAQYDYPAREIMSVDTWRALVENRV